MKASEFIKRKNSDYGIYDNETGLRIIDALLQSSLRKPLKKIEKTKLTLIDNELKKLQQYNEDKQREKILKAYPQAFLKGTARHEYLNAKYNAQDRKRNEDLAVNELVGKYLNNLARVEIQQRAAKRINRIKQREERQTDKKTKSQKFRNPKLKILP